MLREGLLSDTANIDFTTISYWGDDSHLENNWSGKRNKTLASISAVLAQYPDSGIITYGDTNIRHEQQSDVAVEFLDCYNSRDGELRQIAITGHGKIKPALLITNDFDKPCAKLIRKYTRRWLVEKSIAEQIEFFHLNKVLSSMVIKVDFDLTMSILAHNVVRLFAMDPPGYTNNADDTLYKNFLSMTGNVNVGTDEIAVYLKKKRNLPALLTAMEQYENMQVIFFW